MTATEMHDLLRDAKAALYQHDIWRHGETEGFEHILYCRYCHYSQSHGHGDSCLIVRLDAAVTPDGECPRGP